MYELIVDVQNKCRSNKRCKCQGNKRHVSVRAGIIKGTDFGYCTHKIDSQHTRDIKISNVFWQNVELERIGFSNLFETAYSITVFYNKTYDYDPQLIKKPLLIRSKDAGRKTHWYENVGNYANKRWQRINDEALSGGYPEEDKYTNIGTLGDKLKALSCRLFIAHRILINFYQGNNYEIECDICSGKLEIEVKQEDVSKAPGYTKYSYTGKISDNSILVYKGRQLTFQRRTRVKTGYYLPIPVDKDNFNGVSAYYWENDTQRENPLLIEFAGENGMSRWIENISKDKNHDKWKTLSWTDNNPKDLKTRLDTLNCIYNKVVQIRIGESGSCHVRHPLHKNRITCSYGEDYGTDPVLFSHKYWNSEGTRKPLNISEIYVGNDKQNFPRGTTPFRDVKKFTAYVSPCDKEKPFLICIEYERNKNYKWYQKKNKQDPWEEYGGFPSKKSPGDVKTELGNILDEVRRGIGIGKCEQITGAEGIKLKVDETIEKEKSFHTYQYNSGTKKVYIFVTKAENTPLVGFFKNIHTVIAKSGTFVLDKNLQEGGNIIEVPKIPNVKEVEVYFWDANPNTPFLLGITTNKSKKSDTKYYGKRANFWGHSQVEHMNKQQAIDHQNCQVNKAIPIELSKPDNFQSFFPDKMSSCLKYRRVTPLGSPLLPRGADDCKMDVYDITPNDTRISRITYNNESTNIVVTNDVISQLRIYQWDKDPKNIPLLVEFVKSTGGSIFFENLGDGPKYTEWRSISDKVSKNFYEENNPQKELTEAFKSKLHEVNCKVNKVAQLDISQKAGSYCHGLYAGHNKRIQVTRENTPKYSGFIGYEHTPVVGQSTLIISSIYNGNLKQKVYGNIFPLEHVEKLTVYFPTCTGASPVAIRAEYSRNVTWLQRKIGKGDWAISNDFESKNIHEIETALDSIKNTINDACGQLPSSPRFSLPQLPSEPQLPQQSADEDEKKLSWETMLKEAITMEQKEKTTEEIFHHDEDEDEEVVEDQNNVTFMRNPVTVNGVQVNINDIQSPLSTIVPRYKAVKTPLSLIIDLEKNVTKKGYIIYEVSGKKVKLEKEEEPDRSGFYMLIHESENGNPFKVERIQHGSSDMKDHKADLGINQSDDIEHLAVWYWKHNGMKNPLLIEVLKEDGNHVYRSNKGDLSWNDPKTLDDCSEITGEQLEQILDDLNCQHNKAVTMDLSYSNSGSYCCGKHGSNGKVRVNSENITLNSISNVGNKSSEIYYSVHTINYKEDKLAKIKYYLDEDKDMGDKNRKRVTSRSLNLPIQGPVDVYVFYCKENPALMYIKKDEHLSGNKWYKRAGPADHNSCWEEVQNLSGIMPKDIRGSDCKNWNILQGVLNDLGCNTGECHDAPGTNISNAQKLVAYAVQTSQELVIELPQKPHDLQQNTHEYTTEGDKILIKVKLSNEPSANFYQYTHHQESYKPFKLKAVKENDNGDIVTGITDVKDVTSVSSYYWKDENGSGRNPTKALLVEVASSGKDGHKYAYYAKRNGKWVSHNISKPGSPTKEELDLLNCEINNVIQIDVAEISSYCHDGHENSYKKVKVSLAGNSLGNYRAYAHTPNSEVYSSGTNHRFTVSKFTIGSTPINFGSSLTLPLRNTSKIIVYFCGMEVIGSTLQNPLLIYMNYSEIEKNNEWFKSNDRGKTWEKTTELQNRDPSDNTQLFNVLDSLRSPCKPPAVSIDLYRRLFGEIYVYMEDDGQLMVVRGKAVTDATYFTEYIHTVHGRENSYFRLRKVNYKENTPTSGIVNRTSTNYVTQVSVFYWTPLETAEHKKRSRPLLVKVTQQAPGKESTEKYYVKIGTETSDDINWKEWTPNPPTKVVLEKKLQLLNCNLNNAVVINVNERPNSGSVYYDGCDKESDLLHGDKIRVKKKELTPDTSLGSYTVYIHTLENPQGNGKFHISEFINGGVTLNNIGETPFLDVSSVMVHMCGTNPLLVYINSSHTKSKWYKNEGIDNDKGDWKSEDNLNTDTGPENYDEIRKVLNGLKSPCTPEAAEPPKSPEALGDPVSGGVLTGASLYGVVSGAFGGAGTLTGLGWWAFKRSKGDPWVRQI